MQCIAKYEIEAEASVFSDDVKLKLAHPRGLFKVRIKNIVRKDFSAPFLLSLQIIFDSPNLEDAITTGQDHLIECLNMLAYVTGCSFKRHRTHAIVDCSAVSGMRDCRLWSDSAGHENPLPELTDEFMSSIERLLQFDAPVAVRRALRWYRLGVSATLPEDQFQYFWFALEILAEFQKGPEKITDKCPACKSPLYCETCKTYPTHRQYVKQAIQSLILAVDKSCSDETLAALDKARNTLMHGGTLRKIDHRSPEDDEVEIVDVLGRILFMALAHQFPKDIFRDSIRMGPPTTYIRRTMTAVAHVQTVFATDEDGDIDLDKFTGTKLSLVLDPPQSARPSVLVLTPDQHKRIGRLQHEKGDHQEFCRRIHERVKPRDGKLLALVLATDMTHIRESVKRGDTGNWQDLFREIMKDSP